MKKENLIGQVFGRLTVIDEAPRKKLPCGDFHTMWKCKCECGNIVIVNASNLKRGITKSCGCLRTELESSRATTHGFTKNYQVERLYKIWSAIKLRCYNRNHKSYQNYGARGITVCDEWRKDYCAFRNWALENGYDESAKFGDCTIDRIDVNGPYSPENCRWANAIEQQNNTRKNHFITYNGQTKSIAEWARETGIASDTIYQRIGKLGWDPVDAITKPMRKVRKRAAKAMLPKMEDMTDPGNSGEIE